MTLKNKKISITTKKKLLKEKEILLAGYNLFVTRGVEKTAIDDIVKLAGVAKGTFYLYFKDKYDLLDQLILQKSNEIIKDGLKKANSLGIDDFRKEHYFF